MITCKDAQHLFDRYLDGELSPQMSTELHAHRINCVDCQTELAIMEACGDVVGMDTSEPKLRESFTDRVILSYRIQNNRRHLRWRRLVMWTGIPSAAAASVLLALLWTARAPVPQLKSNTITVVAPVTEAAPQVVQESLIQLKGTLLTDEARRELKATPQMTSAGFMDSLLEPLTRHAQHTLESARQGTVELQWLLNAALSEQREQVAAQRAPETSIEPAEFLSPTPLEQNPFAAPGSSNRRAPAEREAL